MLELLNFIVLLLKLAVKFEVWEHKLSLEDLSFLFDEVVSRDLVVDV